MNPSGIFGGSLLPGVGGQRLPGVRGHAAQRGIALVHVLEGGEVAGKCVRSAPGATPGRVLLLIALEESQGEQQQIN